MIKIDEKQLRALGNKAKLNPFQNNLKRKLEYFNRKPFEAKELPVWFDEIKANVTFYNTNYKEPTYEPIEVKKPEKKDKIDFSHEKLADLFLDKYPMFYDKAKILWKWNSKDFYWERIDEIDLRNAITQANKDGLKSDTRNFDLLILQRARLRIPKKPKDTWIQFKSKIYDFITEKSFNATPNYFFTNPIPYDLGENNITPKIDKLFEEWVGKKYVDTLHEITAYCLTGNKFMQRVFALVGGGSNGKTTFATLLQRLLSKENYTSSELKLLAERNFETAIIYRKLLCIVGEVSYEDLSNTSQIKKLSGEDEIRFEFKGKQPFSDKNTASVICLTNSLPRTPDKSLGFYRRWLIVEFPNQFKVGDNPINSISEEEMRNLARKSLEILKKIYKEKKFTNEGSYEDRERIYEEKSNPVLSFLERYCEDIGGVHIQKRAFCIKFNKWLKEKHQRPLSANQITSMLKHNGYDVGSRKINGESTQVVINLSFKDKKNTIITTNTAKNQTHSIREETNSKNGSNYGNLGNYEENPLKIDTFKVKGKDLVKIE